MTPRFVSCLFVVAAGLAGAVAGRAQGPLAPPGPPAPTMRSLDQIYSELTKLTPANPLVLAPMLGPTQQGAIHLSARGQVQGDINGGCTIRGLENTIVCIGFSHEVKASLDATNGLPTGRHQHKPLRVLKYIDQTTPLFSSALVNNENLTSVALRFFQSDPKGNPTNTFKITLTNARVSRVANDFPDLETLEFTYQRIEWLHVPSGHVVLDDWQTVP